MKEIRRRILFTIACIVVFKFISLIPTPGVDSEVAQIYFSSVVARMQGFFKMINAFSGGSFSRMTLMALSIGPYVSATIFVQLFATLSASMQHEIQQSPTLARHKIGMMNRYVTLFLSIVQSAVFARYAMHINKSFPGLISVALANNPYLFYLIFVLSMSSGSMILMWFSEIISQKGIGNGVSIIISVGILSSSQRILSSWVYTIAKGLADKSFYISTFLFTGLFLVVLVWSILLSIGQKDLSVVYAKRISRNRLIQGKGVPTIPLRVNYAGIVPVMFASTALGFCSTLAGFFQKMYIGRVLGALFLPTSVPYLIMYLFLIFGFAYFWTSVQFKPKSIASDLKRSGAFIPGVKQGIQTEKFLFSEMHKTNMVGSVMLCILAAIPWVLEIIFYVERSRSYLVGGTTTLLLVGTIVDVFSQISGYMSNYKQKSFAVSSVNRR